MGYDPKAPSPTPTPTAQPPSPVIIVYKSANKHYKALAVGIAVPAAVCLLALVVALVLYMRPTWLHKITGAMTPPGVGQSSTLVVTDIVNCGCIG